LIGSPTEPRMRRLSLRCSLTYRSPARIRDLMAVGAV
jgi:hypothetical protein